ncbi:MAG TPA: response regulator [bacterium]|nr:response regulator [bacterium]HPN43386.1 response regulator [bacterium]
MSTEIKILLADDDPDFIEINRTILEAKGYDVEEAYTSSEAITKVRAGNYDLLILDLMMEEKDAGFTVAYAIREDERLKELPILMLTSAQEKTGFTFKLSKDQEWMKVDDFAAKPLRPAELVERVEKLLKKR